MKPFILISLLVLTLSGCISYSSDGDSRHNYINGIETGITTTDWLEHRLGMPKSVRTTSKGSEIWHYQFTEEEKTHVSLFIIFSVNNESHSSTDYFFEIVDGFVDSYWQD
ncbi:MAG: hypothetical protein VB957_07250 [Pseudomonadales bacterium]